MAVARTARPGSFLRLVGLMNATNMLADRVWKRWLELDPLAEREPTSNVLGVGDGSIAEAEAFASAGRQFISEVETVAEANVDHEDHLTLEFLRWLLQTWTELPARYWFEFPITPYAVHRREESTRSALRNFTFAEPADTENYLGLVDSYVRQVRQIELTLREQVERGVCLSRLAHPAALNQMNSSYHAIVDLVVPSPSRLSEIGHSRATGLADAVRRLVVHDLAPAYEELLDYLGGSYAAELVDGVGLSQYRGGEAAYRSAAKYWTTTSTTIEELHALGVDQVEMLTDEMARVRSKLGFGGTEVEFHQALAAESQFFAHAPDEVGSRYLAHINRIEPQLSSLFNRLQAAPYGVKQLEPMLEASMTYGFYEAPTQLEPRGSYVYNGSALGERSLLTSASLILHELVPGHHLQIAKQLENRQLPEIRRQSALSTTAYIEGWAEYAAGLGWELGAYEDPYDQYGRLSFERFFAQRLVVDTGMNAFGWTLEMGRRFMKANTLESDVQIESETLRYSTDTPGQALAYRPGFLDFGALRQRATDELGAAFDVREFHEAVLEAGAMPLWMLSGHVDWWIDQSRPESAI